MNLLTLDSESSGDQLIEDQPYVAHMILKGTARGDDDVVKHMPGRFQAATHADTRRPVA